MMVFRGGAISYERCTPIIPQRFLIMVRGRDPFSPTLEFLGLVSRARVYLGLEFMIRIWSRVYGQGQGSRATLC